MKSEAQVKYYKENQARLIAIQKRFVKEEYYSTD